MQSKLVMAFSLIALLVTSTFATTNQAYAAGITKFRIDESGVATIAGEKHHVSLSLDGGFRTGEVVSATNKGLVTIDGANYSVSSATIKVDHTGKKVSISIKLSSSGSIRATMIFHDGIDLSKTTTISTKRGSIVALVLGTTYKVRTIGSAILSLEIIESNISKINNFMISGSPGDDQYTATFQLQDKNLAPFGTDCKVTLSIKDEKNRILYQNEFNVSQSDFKTYEYTFTGNSFLAYSWTFPTSEVKPGFGFFGQAELTFTDSFGVPVKSTYNSISIPRLTDEEIQKINDDAYRKSATTIDQTIEKGPLRITVESAGYYTIDSFGTDKKLYRVDLAITNTGSEAGYPPSDYVILDGDGNQYDNDYHGTFDYKNIYPGVTVRGYQTFDPMPEGLPSLKLVITKNSYPSDYVWEFALPPS